MVPDTALIRLRERLVHWRARRRMARHRFFHDLQCVSGFADRLYGLWAAVTLSRLLEPDSTIAVRWHRRHGSQAHIRNYSTRLFSLEGCEFVDVHPPGALRMPHKFNPQRVNEQVLWPLPSGGRQLILRDGWAWGCGKPEDVHRDLALYGVEAGLALEQVVQRYQCVARSLEPSAAIAACLPADLGQRVGVHVRLTDKLVEREGGRDMGSATWRALELRGLERLDRLVAEGRPLFLCSDDPAYRTRLAERLRSRGGDVLALDGLPPRRRPAGFAPLVDFFALSRCARIVQMTRYSNFTTAAALVGGKALERV